MNASEGWLSEQQSGLIVKMDELERELNKHDPISDIAAIVGKLTYGEMVQLATELVGSGELPATVEGVMKRFHDWQKSRGAAP
jgi:hypothetical protein